MSTAENRSEINRFFTGEYKNLKRFVSVRLSPAEGMEPDEIVHEVLIRLLEKSEITMPLGELAGYIYTALRNRIIDLWRTRIRRDEKEEPEPDDRADERRNFILELEHQERFDLLEEAMDQLSEAERAVIEATELDGFSYGELEEMWSVSAGTLMSRKKRALDKMRAYCKEAENET